MTVSELEKELKKIKLRYQNYSLYGGYLEDGICLSQSNNIYEVYYCERARKYIYGLFLNESDACEYMFCEIKKQSDYNRWF